MLCKIATFIKNKSTVYDKILFLQLLNLGIKILTAQNQIVNKLLSFLII